MLWMGGTDRWPNTFFYVFSSQIASVVVIGKKSEIRGMYV